MKLNNPGRPKDSKYRKELQYRSFLSEYWSNIYSTCELPSLLPLPTTEPSWLARVKWLMQARTDSPVPPHRAGAYIPARPDGHAVARRPLDRAGRAVAFVLRVAPSDSRGDWQEDAGAPRRTGWLSRLA